jgi:hypothetical protein
MNRQPSSAILKMETSAGSGTKIGSPGGSW